MKEFKVPYSTDDHSTAVQLYLRLAWGNVWIIYPFFQIFCHLAHKPDKVKLCNKHDLLFQYLYQPMKISTKLRFTCCIHIQNNADTTLFYDTKNSPTVRKKKILSKLHPMAT